MSGKTGKLKTLPTRFRKFKILPVNLDIQYLAGKMLKIHDLVGKIFNNQDLAIKICHQDLPSKSCWQNWDIQDLAGKI